MFFRRGEMKRSNIKSRLIYSVKYNFFNRHLEVELYKGETFRYFNVGLITYLRLKFAKSPGTFYLRLIKKSYESKLIREY
jgi:hypothetical protein